MIRLARKYKTGIASVIASVKEPRGSAGSDEKRPDGLTAFPWRENHTLWDLIVIDIVVAFYVAVLFARSASAAVAAAQRKEGRYAKLR